jgi:uncharacterized protein
LNAGEWFLAEIPRACHSGVMWIDQRGSEVLSRPECLRLLAMAAKEDHVGRLAVADLHAPLVVPLNFTFHERLVFVRIGPGRVSELAPGSLVAFEIDKVAPSRGEAWSVLLQGLASTVATGEIPVMKMPRPWVPEPGDQVISVRPDVVSGRRFRLIDSSGHEGARI